MTDNWYRKLFFNLAYWRRPRWDTGITPPEVETFSASHIPARALDIGCGTGTNAIYLAKHGWEVWAVDMVRKAIQIGRRKARDANVIVNFQAGDVSQHLNLPGSFSLILDIGCLHSLSQDQRKGYFKNMARLLAPGGHYLLYGFIVSPTKPGFPGLTNADFDYFANWLTLIDLVEGEDPNGRRSVWVEYQNPACIQTQFNS